MYNEEQLYFELEQLVKDYNNGIITEQEYNELYKCIIEELRDL